jgi:dolichol-phosphate mannosyltransferase
LASDAQLASSRPTLSVVVPTYRESANVSILFERMKRALEGLPWEMIIVDDDSPDGTSDIAFALASSDPRLRCLRRVNRTGLAGAVIEGWMSSSADLVAVMDGDLQHDERILPEMYSLLESGSGDLVIGTRLGDEGGLSPARQKLSDLGKWFFHRIAGAPVTDPMSGFFMIRRDVVSELAPRLSPDGFKILVDVILSSGGNLKIVEVPYNFRKRLAGESKLTPLVGLDFLGLVVHHATAGVLPNRFVLFALIGASGLGVHILALSAFRYGLGQSDFLSDQTAATIIAMASNFVLNNEITYRTYRYRGVSVITGFLAFALGCSVGALANIDVASWLYKSNQVWWVAGLSGAVVSVVWNYAISTNLIWRPRRRRGQRDSMRAYNGRGVPEINEK